MSFTFPDIYLNYPPIAIIIASIITKTATSKTLPLVVYLWRSSWTCLNILTERMLIVWLLKEKTNTFWYCYLIVYVVTMKSRNVCIFFSISIHWQDPAINVYCPGFIHTIPPVVASLKNVCKFANLISSFLCIKMRIESKN